MTLQYNYWETPSSKNGEACLFTRFSCLRTFNFWSLMIYLLLCVSNRKVTPTPVNLTPVHDIIINQDHTICSKHWLSGLPGCIIRLYFKQKEEWSMFRLELPNSNGWRVYFTQTGVIKCHTKSVFFCQKRFGLEYLVAADPSKTVPPKPHLAWVVQATLLWIRL